MARYEVEVTRSILVRVEAPNESAARAEAVIAASAYPLEQWVHLDSDVRAFWGSLFPEEEPADG